ncbi:MAG: hypothetical protein ACI4JI_00070 [Ruminiclostridium sp.]
MNVFANNKRKIASLVLCAAVALSAALCGCSEQQSTSDDSTVSEPYWKATTYTINEINAKSHPTFHNDERTLRPVDLSDDALHAYNVMLGYAENILGQDYYVYDYYFADWTDPPNSWIIKVIPYDIAEKAEAEDRSPSFSDEILSLFYKEDGTEINSTIEPYYMARHWMADLKRDVAKSFPDYHVELQISELDNIYPNVLTDNLVGICDYTYIINDGFYDKRDEWIYGNIINIIAPAGTKQSDSDNIFEQLKPILKSYCVTEVYLYTPKTKEGFDEWAEYEGITQNDHTLSEQLYWVEHYTI